jgi:hypothetical protein
MQGMKKSFIRFLALFLTLALAFGQGSVSAAMATTNQSHQMSAMASMAGMDMSASGQNSKGCCSDDGKAMKDAMCSACCAVSAQTAMLSFQSYVPLQYSVAHSYELTDTTAVSKTLPPDLPPPKV